MINQELAKRVANALSEATTTVDAHTRRSKTGKAYNVKQHERKLTYNQREMLGAVYDGEGDMTWGELDDSERKDIKVLLNRGLIRKQDTKEETVFFLTSAGKKKLGSKYYG